MGVNRGKKFEEVVRRALEKVPEVSVDRLHDQTTGYRGSSNICDFIVYRKPYEYYIECKSVHGDTFSIHSGNPERKYGNITNKQWEGLLAKSLIDGVIAGVIVWFVDRDVTAFIPIQFLEFQRNLGRKSVQYGLVTQCEFQSMFSPFEVKGRKKRVFFDYDMQDFFRQAERQKRKENG